MSARSGLRAFAFALALLGAFSAAAQNGPAKNGTDSYGDPLPAGAVARIGTARMRNGIENHSVTFSPDGLTFASAALDGGPAVRLWEAATGKELRQLVPVKNAQVFSPVITSLAFSPDGKYLAGAAPDIHLWELATGRDVRRWGNPVDLIRSLVFSPDGSRIAAADGGGGLRLYDADSGKERRVMKTRALQHPYGQAIAFSPDGKILACGGEDRSVHLYDTETGEEKLACLGHSGPILSVAYSPDGKTIATGSADKTIRIWDAAGGQELRKLEGHAKEVLSVFYAPDGRTLISADFEPAIRFWDAGSGAELRKLKPPGLQPARFAFSPDGKKFLTTSHAVIRLHDLASGKELLPTSGHEREIQILQFSPDGRTLFSQSGDDTIRSWEVATLEEKSRILDHVSAGGSMALSADGRSLVVGTWNDIFLRNVSAGVPEKADRFRIRAREKGSICLAFAPDGKTFAWAVGYTMKKEDHGVHLVQAQTGEEVRILKGHRGMVTAISFAADGKTVATASSGYRNENSIRYWDLSTGEELRKFDARQADSDGQYVRGYVAFSPDLGVVGSSDDRSLALRDGATGKEFARFECEGGLILSAAVFSPDGRHLAVAESRAQTEPAPVVTLPERIRLWEVATGTALATFVHGQGRVSALAFSPDGRTLASGGSDSTILFWDLWGGKAMGSHSADLGRLWGDLADPDGRKAWEASSALAAMGDSAVGFVAEHLRSTRVEGSRVRQWITDLSSPSIAVQLKASKMLGQALEQEGTRAEIEKALGAGPAEDVRARLKTLLSSGPDHSGSRSPEDLRRGRALQLLERLSTAKAKEALRALAGGEASRLSREAQAALVRIDARSEAK